MTRETLEELRERLLRERGVQEMIQARAYEIFQMRGRQPGGEAQDWFHAEGEVLAFLIACESAREDEQSQAEAANKAPLPDALPPAPAAKRAKPRAAAKPADAKKTALKNAASKRPATKKSLPSKQKSKRASDQSKIEESSN